MGANLCVARDELTEQARRPASGDAFGEQVMGAIRRVVPFDGYCLIGLDPCTGMRSFMFSRNGLDGVAAQLAYNEMVELDVNRYVDLAQADVPVGVLAATVHNQVSSPRLHEILRPAGFSSELRLALRARGRVWGALVLFRGDRRRRFDDSDVTSALALAEPLNAAIRRYPVRRSTQNPDPLPSGVILLDANNAVVGSTQSARTWLHDLAAGGLDEMEAEDLMRVVYDVGLAARGAGAGAAKEALSRVRTNSGRWLLVQGLRTDSGSASVTVVLQPATLRQLLPAAAAWFGLTARETEVLDLVARGLPAKQMARQLQLSVLTVNDHLDGIYRKAVVSGREELLAHLT
jgi:DNA-binding CsgD family transcriptional regulator